MKTVFIVKFDQNVPYECNNHYEKVFFNEWDAMDYAYRLSEPSPYEEYVEVVEVDPEYGWENTIYECAPEYSDPFGYDDIVAMENFHDEMEEFSCESIADEIESAFLDKEYNEMIESRRNSLIEDKNVYVWLHTKHEDNNEQ